MPRGLRDGSASELLLGGAVWTGAWTIEILQEIDQRLRQRKNCAKACGGLLAEDGIGDEPCRKGPAVSPIHGNMQM